MREYANNENLDRRYYVDEEFRYRRFDDVQVGDVISRRVNAPPETVKEIVLPRPYDGGGSIYSTFKISLIMSDNPFDYYAGFPEQYARVARRPGEPPFRRPTAEDYY